MKRIIIVGLVGMAILAYGNGYTPQKLQGDPDFTLRRGPTGSSAEYISVVVDGSNAIPVGMCDSTNRIGVVPGSICIHRLDGNVPIYHIEWLDHVQGSGAYYNCYFLLVSVSQPTNILARGIVPLHGHWGGGTGVSGTYSVTFTNNILTITKQQLVFDNSRTAKPLYHFTEEKGWSRFSALIDTTIIRTYLIDQSGIAADKSELRYVTQADDTREDLCSGLKIKPEWVRNPKDIQNTGMTIVIDLPSEEAERRYPTVDNREP